MAEAAKWSLFAYFHSDVTGEHDERREIAEWQIGDVVSWARHRGYDAILLSRSEETVQYRRPARVSGVCHGG